MACLRLRAHGPGSSYDTTTPTTRPEAGVLPEPLRALAQRITTAATRSPWCECGRCGASWRVAMIKQRPHGFCRLDQNADEPARDGADVFIVGL